MYWDFLNSYVHKCCITETLSYVYVTNIYMKRVFAAL